jgi:hypothetical protein
MLTARALTLHTQGPSTHEDGPYDPMGAPRWPGAYFLDDPEQLRTSTPSRGVAPFQWTCSRAPRWLLYSGKVTHL